MTKNPVCFLKVHYMKRDVMSIRKNIYYSYYFLRF